MAPITITKNDYYSKQNEISTLESHRPTAHRLIVHYGNFIDTPKLGDLRIRFKCAVGVCSKTGVIKFIVEECEDPISTALQYDECLKESEIIIVSSFENGNTDSFDTFYFPGFIDTHIHSSQYPNCGIFGNSTLLDWLETYTFPLESSLTDTALSNLTYDAVISQTLKHGTTCAAYYTTIDSESSKIMAKLCKEKGQRAFIGKVCMDQNSPSYYCETLDTCKESSEDVIDYILNELNSPLINPIITPRFAVACSAELMTFLGQISEKYQLPIQTHLSENINEIEFVRKLFNDCNSYTDVYHKFGLLTDKSVFAHCIHLSDSEIDLLAANNSGISHCPISNSSITSGECRVKHLLKKGLKVGLGSDVSGGYSVSILENARQALLVSRHLAMSIDDPIKKEESKLSVADVLYLATQGGANVLNVNSKIGSFDVGKEFDAQLINLCVNNSNVAIFPWQQVNSNSNFSRKERLKVENIIAKWLFNGDDRNIKSVWIQGKLCHSKT